MTFPSEGEEANSVALQEQQIHARQAFNQERRSSFPPNHNTHMQVSGPTAALLTPSPRRWHDVLGRSTRTLLPGALEA